MAAFYWEEITSICLPLTLSWRSNIYRVPPNRDQHTSAPRDPVITGSNTLQRPERGQAAAGSQCGPVLPPQNESHPHMSLKELEGLSIRAESPFHLPAKPLLIRTLETGQAGQRRWLSEQALVKISHRPSPQTKPHPSQSHSTLTSYFL